MGPSFNARKAAQVVAFFATKTPHCEIDILKVVKLVYLSDRASIGRFGFPILDEPHVSMPHGPVNSHTYRYINGEVELDGTGWNEFLRDRANYKVAALKKFSLDDLDELSDADVECLEEVWAKFGHMGKWEIRDWTHNRTNVPEWEDPSGSSSPIPLERIMTMLGLENVESQAATIRDFRSVDEIFASLRR